MHRSNISRRPPIQVGRKKENKVILPDQAILSIITTEGPEQALSFLQINKEYSSLLNNIEFMGALAERYNVPSPEEDPDYPYVKQFQDYLLKDLTEQFNYSVYHNQPLIVRKMLVNDPWLSMGEQLKTLFNYASDKVIAELAPYLLRTNSSEELLDLAVRYHNPLTARKIISSVSDKKDLMRRAANSDDPRMLELVADVEGEKFMINEARRHISGQAGLIQYFVKKNYSLTRDDLQTIFGDTDIVSVVLRLKDYDVKPLLSLLVPDQLKQILERVTKSDSKLRDVVMDKLFRTKEYSVLEDLIDSGFVITKDDLYKLYDLDLSELFIKAIENTDNLDAVVTILEESVYNGKSEYIGPILKFVEIPQDEFDRLVAMALNEDQLGSLFELLENKDGYDISISEEINISDEAYDLLENYLMI